MPTREELIMLQALPLEIKIAKSRLRIREFIEQVGESSATISFSGGKDSTALLHLVRQDYPNIKAVFADTGLEYPEIRKFVRTFENVDIVRPKISFAETIKRHGYPIVSKKVAERVYRARSLGLENAILELNGQRTYVGKDGELLKSRYNMPQYKPLIDAPFKVSSLCCDVMKKEPLKPYMFSIIGTMAIESQQRAVSWMKTGCNAFREKQSMCKPLSFWTENDVLRYIKQNNLPIAKVYGELMSCDMMGEKITTTGEQRTGCVFCGFGVHREKHSRFERLKVSHPKLYDYCINGGEFDSDGLWKPNKDGLGMGFVFDWCNINVNAKGFNIRY